MGLNASSYANVIVLDLFGLDINGWFFHHIPLKVFFAPYTLLTPRFTIYPSLFQKYIRLPF